MVRISSPGNGGNVEKSGMGGNGAKGGVMLALDTLAGADISDVEAASAAVISAIALSLCKRFCASISARVGAALLGAGGWIAATCSVVIVS